MRFVIVFAVFCISFHLIYKWFKKQCNYWGNELSEDSLEDKKTNLENELKEIDKKLKETEKELKEKEKTIKELKGKYFMKN